MRTLPPLGLLLDVDGPIASPVTRRVPEGILTALVGLADRGIPVVFNTGRSADFILQHVAAPLLAAGLPASARFHAVCEKGAVWLSLADLPRPAPSAAGTPSAHSTTNTNTNTNTTHDDGLPRATPGTSVPGWVRVDTAMRLPEDLESRLVDLMGPYRDEMFHDETKLAMFSAEMTVGGDHDAYRAAQSRFETEVSALLSEGEADGRLVEFQLDSTIISTDVEHVTSGKDLGAARGWELVVADGELPVRWFTCGDSRTDYAMADWLHERGVPVTHVDVRPEDGIPETGYPVMTGDDLAELGFGTAGARHEQAGQALVEWALNTMGTGPAMM